jgi:hypothetical protein
MFFGVAACLRFWGVFIFLVDVCLCMVPCALVIHGVQARLRYASGIAASMLAVALVLFLTSSPAGEASDDAEPGAKIFSALAVSDRTL